MKIHGKAWKFGNDVDTDAIIPARYLNTTDSKELASHCMEDADPEFAGKVFENCGGGGSGGFVMGSEIEIPGADRYHTPETVGHRDWKYEFEKNWMRFAVWGRTGYNPKLGDDYWIDRFCERFGTQAGKDAFLALKN